MLIPGASEKNQGASGIFDLPDVIADHTLLRCVGEGSYGRVYLAQNQLTGVYRALKVVFRNAFRDSRPYLREFDAIRKFEPVSRSHAGFVQVLHVGKLENAFYYIMELADDALSGPIRNAEEYIPRTLGLNRGEILPIEQCVEIGSRLADSLSVLHEQNLIHRDIKPSNIIFVNGKPKLADIGLVTQIEEAKSFVGTAGFMPPEGPMSPASDVYSLGKVLYEIATGKDRCEFPQLPSGITSENALDLELNQIVLKACDPDPGKRYASAKDLKHELDLLQAGRSIKRLRQVERRLRFIKIAFAASVILGLGAFAVFYQVKARRERAERERQRLAGYLLAEGTSEMRKGYLSHALPFFIRASEYDPLDLQSHRLRIGSVMASAPNLALKWSSPRRGNFSADGKWLIVPRGLELIVYESKSGRAIRTNALQAAATLAAFSPDRTRIVAGLDSTLLVMTVDGKKLAEHLFESPITDAAFSPAREERIAVALASGRACFFDLDKQSPEWLAGISATSVIFDPQGENVLMTDNKQEVWHLLNSTTRKVLVGPTKAELPYRGAFSPDGSIVVVCGWAAAVPFKAEGGQLAGNAMWNDDAVPAAAFSPSSNLLATANYDGSVRLWNAKTFRPLPINHILEHESRPERVTFVDDSTLITHCTDGTNYVWNLGTKAPNASPIPQLSIPDPLHVRSAGVSLSANGNIISGKIGNIDIHVKLPNPVNVIAVSPRKDAFAAGSQDDRFEFTDGALYRLGDLENPIRINHKDGINHIVFSHSGEMLATCSEDFSAIIWDAKTGKRRTQPMRHSWQVMAAAFSLDDRWLVTAGADQVCIVWNVSNGEPLTTPLQIGPSLRYVAFEPDNRGIVASSRTNTYRLDLPFADLPLKDRSKYLQNWIEPTITASF
jgi:WD40 repeat protein